MRDLAKWGISVRKLQLLRLSNIFNLKPKWGIWHFSFNPINIVKSPYLEGVSVAWINVFSMTSHAHFPASLTDLDELKLRFIANMSMWATFGTHFREFWGNEYPLNIVKSPYLDRVSRGVDKCVWHDKPRSFSCKFDRSRRAEASFHCQLVRGMDLVVFSSRQNS